MEKLVQKRGNTLVVKIQTEVDHCFADAVREEVDRLVQTEEIECLEFDFSETEFMDSSGIGLVMGRYKILNELGGTLEVTGLSDNSYKVMRLAGLDRIANIKKGGSKNGN